ncbi:MAG: CAP domain-containing protein [Chloroflexi bacterium]|nr:CAP domain-containing protein [Chloroflexota bacterium]
MNLQSLNLQSHFMTNWLKLTDADIEGVQPERLTIHPDDLPSEPAQVVQTAVLQITHQDLIATNHAIPSPDTQQLAQLMWQLTNQARQAQRLPRLLGTANLKWHHGLAQVARQHSQDMLNRHYVEHTTPEGLTAVQRIQHSGINYMACAENIGVVYGPNSHTTSGIYDIHDAFMEQPHGRVNNHRSNLLNPLWTHVGIGIAYNINGALFATQNFISAI